MRALSFALILAVAGSAVAQERNAAQRESLVALARVLGEAQALRQVCSGVGDPTWRSQFEQMLIVEAADEKLDAKLRAGFDQGYRARGDDFAACGHASRLAEADAALRGRDLASGLARATIRVHPDDSLTPLAEPMAEDAAPR